MKAAIFDMDGTILDSMGMWRDALPTFMKRCGLAADEEFFRNTMSLTMQDTVQYLIDNYGLTLTAEQLQQQWEDYIYNEYMTSIQPKPYAVEYLMLLKEQGVKLAIATLTDHKLADPALAKHRLDQVFDIILTCEDVGGVSKSEPDLFLYAAKMLGATAEQSVVYEDSIYAIQAALRGGFDVVAIDDPNASKREKIKEIAPRYIYSWKELYDEQQAVTL